MSEILRSFLQLLNQTFEAGIAVTALSLFLRALTFNLRDRVSRSFAVILACVMVVFSGEAISGAMASEEGLTFWLRFQWVGLVYFPVAYMHFADAVLETTGRPSRGRRRRGIRLAYGIATAFLAALPLGLLVGPVEFDAVPYPRLAPGLLSPWFFLLYLAAVAFAAVMLHRAYGRTRLGVSQRRIGYFQIGALVLAAGMFPYLQITSGFAERFELIFLGLVVAGNLAVFWFLVLMAYAVAFFGVPWPDRIIRSRLLKWLLRGPVTLFAVLILMTATHIISQLLGSQYSVAIPIITVTSVLLLEHAITLVYPTIERWFFYGPERGDVELLHNLEERLISTSDLRQFLEAVLASVCDKFQVSTAFVAALGEGGLETIVAVGKKDLIDAGSGQDGLHESIRRTEQDAEQELFAWGEFWLYPLYSLQQPRALLGILGVQRRSEQRLEEDLAETLTALGRRAAVALEDRRLQQQLLASLEALRARVGVLQRMRAAVRYDQRELLSDTAAWEEARDLSQWVKDALSHYWGGPKLTENPLLSLRVVQEALVEHEGNPANAMRAILKQAVEKVRPEGERRFTGEWILYNILEMKFMEGRKVREIALKLAMSEADLYRKQRVAIESVAGMIMEMEREAHTDLK
ncbi:MAG: hypothetical protein HYZ26_12675 [Chloroflexi bacterium]|nr:hypothetical protein [Chloroflexota bacterium]